MPGASAAAGSAVQRMPCSEWMSGRPTLCNEPPVPVGAAVRWPRNSSTMSVRIVDASTTSRSPGGVSVGQSRSSSARRVKRSSYPASPTGGYAASGRVTPGEERLTFELDRCTRHVIRRRWRVPRCECILPAKCQSPVAARRTGRSSRPTDTRVPGVRSEERWEATSPSSSTPSERRSRSRVVAPRNVATTTTVSP